MFGIGINLWRLQQVALSSGPYVLTFTGADGEGVNCGYFWPDGSASNVASSLGTSFWWEAWLKPTVGGYWICDGYGGNHSLLDGPAGGLPGVYSGNIWNGSAAVSFAGTYSVAAGEWHYRALAWDGSTLYGYINGICEMEVALTTRVPVSWGGGNGLLYIGSHTHQGMAGSYAAVRGFDRGNSPRNVGTHRTAFAPYRSLPTVHGQASALPDFIMEFNQPNSLMDKSPRGVSHTSPTGTVQTVTITGTPTGGTFTLTFGGQTTGGIAYNATAADVTTALAQLSTIRGDVYCTGGALPGTAVTVYFKGVLSQASQSAITASGASLTGGTSPAVTLDAPAATFDATLRTHHNGYLLCSQLAQIPTDTQPTKTTGVNYPVWVQDPTCPYGSSDYTLATGEVARTPAAVPAGAVVWDSFERANQTFAFQVLPSLGSTEGGSAGIKTWTDNGPITGTGARSRAAAWGILGGAAVYLETVPGSVTVPTGISDVDVQVTRDRTAGNTGWVTLAFRGSDKDNWWSVAYYGSDNAGKIQLAKVVAGARSTVLEVTQSSSTWDVLRVLANGNSISIYTGVAGVFTQQGATQTDAFNATADGCGLGYPGYVSLISSLARHKDFLVKTG